MPRCEDYPACGHGPESTGGDGGGCPNEDGSFNCAACGAKLQKNARSSICRGCLEHQAKASSMFNDQDEDY